MFLKKTFFASLILVLLAGLLVISCPGPDDTDLFDNAEAPAITVQPTGGNWNVSEDDEFTLTVTANSPDGGTLSYQWHKNSTNSATGGDIAGTTNPLTLEKAHYTGDGDLYFYVVVTNTNNAAIRTKTATATSSVVKVTVSGNGVSMVNAQSPNISVQPLGGEWNIEEDDEFLLTVTATVTDGGTLSYQWYKNTTNSTTGGTEIGEDDKTLTLDKEDYEVGDTLYFYVVVTNTITDNDDGGVKTASTTSNVVKVTVTDDSVTNDPIIEGLIGEWEEEYSTYTITDTTFSSDMGEYGGYGGTIVNHRGDGTNAGYITIQYTSNDYAPDAIGAYYVIHYENLTATTMDISGAYDADDSTENGFTGKATQKEAERAYTTANGCFAQHTTITRVTDNGPVNAHHPSITVQPTGGFWNIWLPSSHAKNTANLTVTAGSPVGGSLSYQWYVNSANSESGSTLLTGKTSATLSLTAAEIASTYTTIDNGTNYFYVVVTNTIAENNDGGTKTAITRSNIANVTVDGVATGIIGKWTADYGDWFEITSGFHFSASDYTGIDVFFAGAIQYVSFFTSEFGIIIIKYDEGKEIVWWSGDERTGDYYGIYIDNIKPGVSMAISQTSDQNNSYGPTETTTLDEAITRFDADGGGVWFFEGMTPDYFLE